MLFCRYCAHWTDEEYALLHNDGAFNSARLLLYHRCPPPHHWAQA